MFVKIISIATPILYWMGLIQGDRKIDGLGRWDGTLTSLVVPPHLLKEQRKDHFEQSARFYDSPPFSSPDYSPRPSYIIHTPQSSPTSVTAGYAKISSAPRFSNLDIIAYLSILAGTALALSSWMETKRSVQQSALLQGVREELPRIKTLRKEVEMLRYEVQARDQLIQALEEEASSLSSLRQQNDQMIQQLQEEKTSIQDDLLGKAQLILSLEGELRERDTRLEASVDEKAELERNLTQQSDQKIQDLQDEKTSIQDDVLGKAQRILALEDEVREKDRRLEASVEEKAELERTLTQQNDQRIQDLQDEKTSIQDDLLDKAQRVLNLEDDLEERDRRLEAWATEKAEMESASQQKETRIQALEVEKAEFQRTSLEEETRTRTLEADRAESQRVSLERETRIRTLEADRAESQRVSLERETRIRTLEAEKAESERASRENDESKNVGSGGKNKTNGGAGGYSLKQADLQDPTFIAADAAINTSLPPRPPTPSITTHTPVGLPPRPQFTGLPTPKSNAPSGPPHFFGNSVRQSTSPTGGNSGPFPIFGNNTQPSGQPLFGNLPLPSAPSTSNATGLPRHFGNFPSQGAPPTGARSGSSPLSGNPPAMFAPTNINMTSGLDLFDPGTANSSSWPKATISQNDIERVNALKLSPVPGMPFVPRPLPKRRTKQPTPEQP